MKSLLFTPENVSATREERKTQTRRLLNPQPPDGYFFNGHLIDVSGGIGERGDVIFGNKENHEESTLLEYIRHGFIAGETRYVKEVHWCFGCWTEKAELKKNGELKRRFIDCTDEKHPCSFVQMTPFENNGLLGWYKRSPLFLPEKHARTFVRIESVKVERLRDISVEDSLAEGISHNPMNYPPYEFALLWNSINEKRGHGWDKNEWVVAVEYKMIGREKAYE
jgi:hypothetical protein